MARGTIAVRRCARRRVTARSGRIRGLAATVRSPRVWLGLLATLLLAVALYAQFSIDDRLSRDEAIFTYGAQQLAHGVPYYKSASSTPRRPVAPTLGWIGIEATKLFGGNDVHGVRVAFFVFAVLGRRRASTCWPLSLWRSVVAGLVSAAVFLSFKGFAVDAIGGPDAKTPGIAFAVFAMLLLVRRRFFWGGVLGALAFLCWQPLGAYVIAAIVAAFAMSPAGQRLRSTLLAAFGALIPVAAAFVYFWLAGALSEFVDAAFVFPLSGVQRNETLGQRIGLINDVIHAQYNVLNGWLLYGGLALLGAAVALVLWRGRPPAGPRVRKPPRVRGGRVGVAAHRLHPARFPGLPGRLCAASLRGLGRGVARAARSWSCRAGRAACARRRRGAGRVHLEHVCDECAQPGEPRPPGAPGGGDRSDPRPIRPPVCDRRPDLVRAHPPPRREPLRLSRLRGAGLDAAQDPGRVRRLAGADPAPRIPG